LAEFQQTSQFPEVPEVHEVPEVPEVPEVSKVQGASQPVNDDALLCSLAELFDVPVEELHGYLNNSSTCGDVDYDALNALDDTFDD